MAASSAPRSLDEILQADRKKRKAEALAQKIFSNKDRRQSAPSREKELKPQSPGASFASRVGINKRSTSSSSTNRQKQPARPNPPSALSRSSTLARLETVVNNNGGPPSSFEKNKRAKHTNGQSRGPVHAEISVRGAAGPYTVVAENFAPDTTAADIETVISSTGGPMESCRLVKSDAQSVTAELILLDKTRVDAVIATFHGKKADGYELNVYLKKAGRDAGQGLSEQNPWRVDSEPAATIEQPIVVQDEVMEVEPDTVDAAYRDERERRDDHARPARIDRSHHYGRDGRRDDRRDDRRPDLMYQNGGYGYDDRPPPGPRYDRRQESWGRGGRGGGGGGGRMYSDDLMRRPGPPPQRRW